jgi:hypothetical protein
MTAITLRNLPPEVARAIREKAKKEKISLNRAVISLLAEATGLGQQGRKDRSRDELDALAGSWTKEEADEFDAFLREHRTIDPEMWK